MRTGWRCFMGRGGCGIDRPLKTRLDFILAPLSVLWPTLAKFEKGRKYMALIRCIECEKEISDKAPVCIHCGCPVEASTGVNAHVSEPENIDIEVPDVPNNFDSTKR